MSGAGYVLGLAGKRLRRRDGGALVAALGITAASAVLALILAGTTVAKDRARVRTIVTATHTQDQLEFALDTFKKVGRELGLI